MNDEELAAIRERAENASDGPWKIWGMTVMADPKNTSNVDDCDDVAFTVDRQRGLRTFNAEFIAHTREDVPALLVEVERLTGERDKWREDALINRAHADRVDLDLFAKEARLDKVRALHAPGPIVTYWGHHRTLPDDTRVCTTCTDPDASGPDLYPCPTIQAIDGSEQS